MKLFALSFLILIVSFSALITLNSCVESINDTEKASTAIPTIDIYSPSSNDSIMVGKTPIYFQALDGTGGQGLSHFDLYINNSYQGKFSVDSDGNNPALNLQLDSTLLNSRISYYVTVYNKTGKFKQSKIQENIFIKDKIPNAPTNLFLGRISDFEITVRWDDKSSNEEGFELWRKDAGSAGIIDYRRIRVLPLNTITYRDNGVSPFVDYFYKVRAFNKSGYSAFSNELGSNSIPGGPWALTATAIGSSMIHLKWVDFAVSELGFQVERKNAYEQNYKVISLTAPNTEEYYDTGVDASGSYTYRVAYFTSTALSSYSNEVSVSTFYTNVPAPSSLAAAYLPAQGLILTWKDNSNSLAIQTSIERRTGISGSFSEIGTVEKDVITYTDKKISSGTVYYYRIRQKIDKNAYTPYSGTIKVDIP